MSANDAISFGLQIVFVCLYITQSHYHHCANLSEDIGLIKCLSDKFLSSVWVRLSIFFQLSIVQYMGLCIFSLPISFVMIERIHTLSYYHHQIRSMNYYLLFRVRSWNNSMRCMSPYILIGCIVACGSCSLVCILHNLIIIIMQNYLKTLKFPIACQLYAVECVYDKIISLNFPLFIIKGNVSYAYSTLLCWSWERVLYILLSSSNRKYETLTNVYG